MVGKSWVISLDYKFSLLFWMYSVVWMILQTPVMSLTFNVQPQQFYFIAEELVSGVNSRIYGGKIIKDTVERVVYLF